MTHKTSSLLLVSAVLCSAVPAFAATRYYVGPDGGNWSSAANWSATDGGPGGAGIPQSFDSAFNTTNNQIVLDIGPTLNSLVLDGPSPNNPSILDNGFTVSTSLTLGATAGHQGSFILQNGTLQYSAYIGAHGTGNLSQSGGNKIGDITLGQFTDGSGNYFMSGGSIPSGFNNIVVGQNGSGNFIQTGGSNSGNITLAQNAGSFGNYSLSAGTINSTTEKVGGNGTALFLQTGGTNTAFSFTMSPTGAYHLNSGTLTITKNLYASGTMDFGAGNGTIAAAASTVLDLSSATILGGSQTTLSIAPTSIAMFKAGVDPNTIFKTVTGGGAVHNAGTPLIIPAGSNLNYDGTITDFLQATGNFSNSSNGTLYLRGGIFVSGGTIGLGTLSPPVGTQIFVDDPNSGMSSGNLQATVEYIGYNGTGKFTQTGGSNVASNVNPNHLYIGYNAGSDGTYEMDAGGSVSILTVGYSGNGTVNQNGGSFGVFNAFDYISPFYLGYDIGSHGTFNLHGGQVYENAEYIGFGGNADFTQTAGNHTIVTTVNTPSSGFFYLAYGQDTVANYSLAGGNFSAFNETISLAGLANFTQTGGSNTVAIGLTIGTRGTYTLSGGSLSALGVFNNGNVSITGGSTTISSFFNSGSFAIGSAGVLNAEELQCQPSSHLTIELTSTASFGRIALTEASTRAGTLVLTTTPSFVPHLGDSFTVINDSANLTGKFSSISSPTALPAGLAFAVIYHLHTTVVFVALNGDTNLDQKVDITDLNTLGDNWLATSTSWSTADFNGDGKTDISDLNLLATNWSGGGASFDTAIAQFPQLQSAAVPEPASLAFLALGLLQIARRRAARQP